MSREAMVELAGQARDGFEYYRVIRQARMSTWIAMDMRPTRLRQKDDSACRLLLSGGMDELLSVPVPLSSKRSLIEIGAVATIVPFLGFHFRTVLVACLVIASGGGKKSKYDEARETVARYRADVEKTYAALAKLETALPTASKLAYDGPPLNHDNTIVLPLGPEVISKLRMSHFESTDPLFDNPDLRNPNYALLGMSSALDGNVDANLKWFTHLKYAVLIKTLDLTRGKAIGDGKMEVGHVIAEAHVFEIGGRYFGAVTFEASNSSRVGYTEKQAHGARVSDDIKSQLEIDLRDNAYKALHNEMAAAIPKSDLHR